MSIVTFFHEYEYCKDHSQSLKHFLFPVSKFPFFGDNFWLVIINFVPSEQFFLPWRHFLFPVSKITFPVYNFQSTKPVSDNFFSGDDFLLAKLVHIQVYTAWRHILFCKTYFCFDYEQWRQILPKDYFSSLKHFLFPVSKFTFAVHNFQLANLNFVPSVQ